jgi:hypothetical protein
MYPLMIIRRSPKVYLNWLLLKKSTTPKVFLGVGAFAGFFICFAIRVIKFVRKVNDF